METYSLFELNEYIRRVVALNFSDALWIKCEVSQVGKSRGHWYIELVEKSEHSNEILAQNSAVLWRSSGIMLAKKYGNFLEGLIQKGTLIRIKVKVEFHERYGLKLVVEDIDPEFTLGNLERQRLETIDQLTKAGHLERNAAIPLAMVPQRIAVLSSETAAGYRDFFKHLINNAYDYHFMIDFYQVAVQGVNTEPEIVQALKEIGKLEAHYDCVVIIRGGGSRIDLAGFDKPALCEAIARCPLPVITGIGHETDQSIADMVAHTASKTPTAAADFLIDRLLRFDTALYELQDQIVHLVRTQAYEARLGLRHSVQTLSLAPRDLISRHLARLDEWMERAYLTSFTLMKALWTSLEQSERIITTLDPRNVLRRGFSITRKDGMAVKSRGLQPEDIVEIEFSDGHIKSKIIGS